MIQIALQRSGELIRAGGRVAVAANARKLCYRVLDFHTLDEACYALRVAAAPSVELNVLYHVTVNVKIYRSRAHARRLVTVHVIISMSYCPHNITQIYYNSMNSVQAVCARNSLSEAFVRLFYHNTSRQRKRCRHSRLRGHIISISVAYKLSHYEKLIYPQIAKRSPILLIFKSSVFG